MKKGTTIKILLVLLFAVLMSIPFLVEGSALIALVALVPLLELERICTSEGCRHTFLWYFISFILWNALTTFWVCNATVGGGIFAVVANSLFMSAVFALFRASRKAFPSKLSYIFLAVLWIAWERIYHSVPISWPWLTLGNAFAGDVKWVQWYEYTGVMGGSAWIWACNLAVFGILRLTLEGAWKGLRKQARAAVCIATAAVFIVPPVVSAVIWRNFSEKSEGTVDALIAQPNFDPYHKFELMSRSEQDDFLMNQYREALEGKDRQVMLVAPETFTSDIILNDISTSHTYGSLTSMLRNEYPSAEIVFGASTWDIVHSPQKPDILARKYGYNSWSISHNSALLLDSSGQYDLYHKSRLVVGTELTPFPKIFVPLDDALGGVMGRCKGQSEAGVLNYRDSIPVGCAICYESVYGEYCTEFVRKGAKIITVITNDAWWGDTPGYRQHFNFSRLRAIELRRDIIRCGNTGISAFINQRGDVLSKTEWWKATTLEGSSNLSSEQTFFVRHGDIIGRICVFISILMLALLLTNAIKYKKEI